MKILFIGAIMGYSAIIISKYFICQIQGVLQFKNLIKQYLLVYTLCIITSLLISYTLQHDILYMLLIIIVTILISIDIIDSNVMIIPDSLLCVLLLFVIWYASIDKTMTIAQRGIGMWAISAPMLITNLCISEAFGGGDIKLMIIIGYFLGWEKILVTMVLAILIGGIYASWLLILGKIKEEKHIPFAPYLCKSIIIVMFFGEYIIHWYLI